MKQQTNIVEYSLIAEEFNWEIKPGKTIRAWGFNQQVPGPLLRARKGDTLVITAENKLSEPILIHWHGLRVPSAMDGHDGVQKHILPGEKYEYRFEVPDAGTYWYHSHHNETVQMERGLYGGIVIRDEEEELIVDKERVFMIDDMKLTSTNEFKQHGRFGRWKERHDGREGSTCLLNGKEDLQVQVHAGQVERWRFINAASARYFRLSLGGRPFQVIATDGNLLETAQTMTELLITPGERYDIIAGPFKEGDQFPIETLPYNRTTFLNTRQYQYATVQVNKPRISNAYIPEQLNSIEWLAPKDAVAGRTIRFSVAASLKRGMDFVINDKMHYHDEPVNAGELQVWEIKNTSLMDHPFHLHGFFFQVLEVNGKAATYKAWKDTFNLAPKTTIKIAWLPDNRPGNWMYHCHILEHHAAGMMGHFTVIDPSKGPVHQDMDTMMHHHA